MTTIALDAMGGDSAPRAEVEGAILAARELDVRVLLVGIEATVRLPQSESAQVVADACALWTKNAQAPTPASSERGEGSEGSEACEGADGGIAFTARIEDAQNKEDIQLTMQLNASDR